MGIDLHWEDENGEMRQMVSDDGFFVSELINASKAELSVCLRFIDRFGDTVFNQAQLPYLKAELKSIPETALGDGARKHRQKLINLIEQATGKTHTYLKFHGD